MPSMSQAGIPGAGNGILMPKLKNRWRVIFVGIGQNQGNSADLSLQATTASRPNLSFEEVPIHRYNSVSYVAGKHSWEPMNLTVEDDVTNRASIIIQNQLEAQQKLIGADGPWLATAASASSYKFATRLEQLDGDETVLEAWVLEGCYLSSVEYGEGDYSASEAHTINLTVRFDNARQILTQNAIGTAIGGVVN